MMVAVRVVVIATMIEIMTAEVRVIIGDDSGGDNDGSDDGKDGVSIK